MRRIKLTQGETKVDFAQEEPHNLWSSVKKKTQSHCSKLIKDFKIATYEY